MRQMDSGALIELDRILGLGGGGEQSATLDDGNVSQVLDLQAIIRRSLTFARTGGQWVFTYVNVHPGADTQANSLNPYLVDPGVNSYPTIVPEGFDAWVLYAGMKRFTGAGNITAGILELSQFPNFVGKGDNTLGTLLTALGRWDAIEGGSGQGYGVTGASDTLITPMLRIRRGASLTFRTTSTAAATFHMFVQMGVFPAGLGQDVVA